MKSVWVARCYWLGGRHKVFNTTKEALDHFVDLIGPIIDSDWQTDGIDRWNSKILAGRLIDGQLTNGTHITFWRRDDDKYLGVEIRPGDML